MKSHCVLCFKDKSCKIENGHHLADCPTLHHKEMAEAARQSYQSDDDFFLHTLRQVAAGYTVDDEKQPHPCKTRLEELIDFCHRMRYRKIGLAFCTALEDDAKKLAMILTHEGFDVVSAVCKVGGLLKSDIGLEEEGKIVPGRREITCNPMMQAEIMNQAKTDFNIVFGLCLGHDSVFMKHSNAMSTVFVVKDRVMQHNPLQGLREYSVG